MNDPIETELVNLARIFIELQQARHEADYNTSHALGRLTALDKIYLAEQAFRNWQTVKSTPNAKVFLAALLLQKRWNR